MESRKIKNINGEGIAIEVIRYFINNDTEYLIYSLNENDDAGYTKLYASKIIGTKACIITDNDEWNLIKEIIKQVVKSNRDGSELNIIDLNEDTLNDIVLQDTRVFKLQGNLVNLLSLNKKVILKEEPDLELEEEIDDKETETIDMDYEELYNEELEKNHKLEERINELIEENNSYKDKIETVIDILK